MERWKQDRAVGRRTERKPKTRDVLALSGQDITDIYAATEALSPNGTSEIVFRICEAMA